MSASNEARSRAGEEPRRTRARLWLALVVLLGLAHALSFLAPFEDAFITYRYAENLARGQGLVYNPGERVEGFTSFLWTVLLAATTKIGLPVIAVSQVLSIAFGIACVVLAAHAVEQMEPDAGFAPSLAGAIVAAHGTWAYYAGSGMETTLFAALVTFGALAAARGRFALAGLIFGVSAMTRPEGVGYALLVAMALSVTREGAERRGAAKLLAVFAALFVPYFALRFAYFGHALPNTYYAKASPSLALFRAGLVHAEAFLTTQLFVVSIVAATALAIRRRTPLARISAAFALGAVANAILVGGDTFAFYRFFLPAIPLGAASVAVAASRARPIVANGGPLVVAVATFAAELLPTRSLLQSRPQSEWARVASVAAINRDYFAVGRYLKEHVDPHALLATNAAGIVPYVSGLPTLDMLGLNDTHIAHRPIDLGRGVAGHEKHDAAYVLSRKPDVILLGLPVLAKRPLRPGELDRWVGRWFPYLPGDKELYESPEFRRDYQPIGAQVGAEHLVMFVRR